MKKKEIKKIKLKPRKKAEMKRDHLSVILERMEYKSDLMSEGFLGLNKKVDNLDKKINNLDKKVDNNHKEFKEFRNETNSNFKTVLEYLSGIDDRIQAIELELADLKNVSKNKDILNRVVRAEKEIIVIKRELALCRKNN